VKTTYSQNVRSMLKYEYDSVFFVCRKPWKKNLNWLILRFDQYQENELVPVCGEYV
jgi:hypothetical protein